MYFSGVNTDGLFIALFEEATAWKDKKEKKQIRYTFYLFPFCK